MTATKKQIDSPQVVENEIEHEVLDAAEESHSADLDGQNVSPQGEDTDTKTVPIKVVLSNGIEITLEVVKDQADWDYAAVEAMAEMNYPVLVNAILTKVSKLKLKAAGARVRDFEMITGKVSDALGVIKDEIDAEDKK